MSQETGVYSDFSEVLCTATVSEQCSYSDPATAACPDYFMSARCPCVHTYTSASAPLKQGKFSMRSSAPSTTMFRLPTHLESLIPPPNDQVPQPRPWRGVFTIPGAHQGTPTQELYVTAAETEGDSQAEKWPSRFHVHVIGQRGVLQQIYDWTKRNTPPMCIFMPDRLPQQASSQANHAQFEAFAQHLLQNQLIAVASWGGSSTLRGAGIILYPTATARAFLVGAIFLETRFPDFVVALSPGPSRSLTSPRQLVPLGHNPDEGAPPNIASSLRYTQSGARSHG